MRKEEYLISQSRAKEMRRLLSHFMKRKNNLISEVRERERERERERKRKREEREREGREKREREKREGEKGERREREREKERRTKINLCVNSNAAIIVHNNCFTHMRW